LVTAARHVVAVPDRETWDYGWCSKEYRDSDRAAIATPSGPVTITGEGLTDWEHAVEALSKEPEVRKRWGLEELWGLMASMTAAAAAAADSQAFVNAALQRLRKSGPALTVLLISNASWVGPPLEVSGMVLGLADDDFLTLLRDTARGRPAPSADVGRAWLAKQVAPRVEGFPSATRPVAFGSWSLGQMSLANDQAERRMSNLIDLCLLLEADLPGHQIYRRGPTNRPGVRGLTLDRGAVERGLTGPSRMELYSEPLTVKDTGVGNGASWYGAEPLPLGELLRRDVLRTQVASCFRDDPVSNRLRVAARWFAEAHYSLADDDTALALGVALDALLTGKAALSGSAMADRFAMLAALPEERPERVRTYLQLYKVRSSVAHGGAASNLDQALVNTYYREVKWAAARLLALRDVFHPTSEDAVKACFDDLRWGVRRW
jgi:hypothetical protein